jgi:hypothetical protein
MTAQSEPSAIDAFVDALHGTGCQLATMLAHMDSFRASGRSAPGAPPPEDTLRRLLGDVLGPALRRLSDDEIHAAARVVDLAATTISDELFLVTPDPMLPRRPRRRRRSRH